MVCDLVVVSTDDSGFLLELVGLLGSDDGSEEEGSCE